MQHKSHASHAFHHLCDLILLALVCSVLASNVRASGTNDYQNWFSLGPQFGLHLNARFRDMAAANTGLGLTANGLANRVYQDGYVLVDSSGDAGGMTWNWGYQNPSQIHNGALTLHGDGPTTVNDTVEQDNNLAYGFDLAYGHDFGKVLGGKWGVQAAFDFSDVSISDNQPFTGTQTMYSDSFSLGGIIAPQAPYAGTFNGPGALISATPGRSISSEPILLPGQRKLDAQVYALRLGPYIELPICRRFAGRLDGGLTLAVAETSFSYSSQGFVGSASGSSDGADFHAGGYVEGDLIYVLTQRVSLFAGAQFEYLGNFTRTAGTEQAQLDLGSMCNFLVGCQWRF